MVQALLDKEPYDSVGVEDEIAALCLLVTDHTNNDQISMAGGYAPDGEGTHESSAMSCGVWGRTVTLSKSTSVETVAVGFWLAVL
jgi:hypothetical protein